MTEHLVFPYKHLCLCLIKRTLITSTENPITTFGTDGCWSQSGRCSAARCSRSSSHISSSQVYWTPSVMKDWWAWVWSDQRHGSTGAAGPMAGWDGLAAGSFGYSTAFFNRGTALASLNSLKLKLLLADNLKQSVLDISLAQSLFSVCRATTWLCKSKQVQIQVQVYIPLVPLVQPPTLDGVHPS